MDIPQQITLLVTSTDLLRSVCRVALDENLDVQAMRMYVDFIQSPIEPMALGDLMSYTGEPAYEIVRRMDGLVREGYAARSHDKHGDQPMWTLLLVAAEDES